MKDSKNIIIQAKQDHEWEINAFVDGVDLKQETYNISTSEILEINVFATNIGNMIDDLSLETSIEIELHPDDLSSGWSAIGDSVK